YRSRNARAKQNNKQLFGGGVAAQLKRRMNMKNTLSITKKMTVAALAIALSALNMTSFGQVRSTSQFTLAPDVTVKIEAFEDAACTKSIPQGSSIPYSGGAPKNFIKFTIINLTSVPANNFTYKLVVRNNGLKVYDPPAAQLSLGAKGVQTFVAAINLPSNTNSIEAKALVNIGGFMQELPTANNAGSFTYTAKVAH